MDDPDQSAQAIDGAIEDVPRRELGRSNGGEGNHQLGIREDVEKELHGDRTTRSRRDGRELEQREIDGRQPGPQDRSTSPRRIAALLSNRTSRRSRTFGREHGE